MPQLLPLLLLVAALLAGLLVWRGLRRRRDPARQRPAWPAQWDLAPRPVFNADERRLHQLLRTALPEYTVLAKLPLVRFCQPTDAARVQYWYELLGSRHVGFAVCDADGQVVAAVELADDTGGPPRRSTRIKQAVLSACRVNHLRCHADRLPTPAELRALVQGDAAVADSPGWGRTGQASRSSARVTGPAAALAPVPPARTADTAAWPDTTVLHDEAPVTARPAKAARQGERLGGWFPASDRIRARRPAIVGDDLSRHPILRP